HVDDAFDAQQSRYGSGCYAVLARAGLGYDAVFVHTAREQPLTQAVVDFVRSGVQQILALEVDPRSAEVLAQAPGEVQRRRPSRIVSQQVIQLLLEAAILPGVAVCFLQLL